MVSHRLAHWQEAFDEFIQTYTPELEELILLSSISQKYPVKTIKPLLNCKKLRRLFLEFNTEDKSFRPEDFAFLDVFQYQCDRKRNFTY